MDNCLTFIQKYNQSSLTAISFYWDNQKLTDLNQDFRQNIANYLLEKKVAAPLNLVRDLFLEEARWTAKSRKTRDFFAKIGVKLLKEGSTQYLKDFLEAYTMSFDTFAACRTMDVTGVNIPELLKYIDKEIKIKRNEEIVNKLECGRELLTKYQKNLRKGFFGCQNQLKKSPQKNFFVKLSSKVKTILKLK